jgi:hypothetical protein
MRSAAELGKTLGVLVALWLILGVIGWAAGAFPLVGGEPTDDDADAFAAIDDAGVASEDDASAERVEADDAWVDEPDAGRSEALSIASVCTAPPTPTWAIGDLVGDARAEIVVGCASGIDVLAWPVGAAPTRIAHAAPSRAATLIDAMIGDVDGDSASDLVLALDIGLVLVPRDASGGFGTPRTLAPSRNGALALGALDTTPGLDVAVVHGADPRAELWLYRGGPTPVRTDTTPAPVGTAALVVIDLDVDGHLDLVAVGAQQILLAFGDSRAQIARTRSLTPGGRGAVVIDVDGDAAPEIVVERDGGACVLDPSPTLADAGECTPLPSIDASARSLTAAGDALLGVRHPDVVAWHAGETRTIATLATTRFGLHRVTRDPEGLVLLGSSETAPTSPDAVATRTIELARASEGSLLTEREERTDVVDAPLVLTIALPDPDAP